MEEMGYYLKDGTDYVVDFVHAKDGIEDISLSDDIHDAFVFDRATAEQNADWLTMVAVDVEGEAYEERQARRSREEYMEWRAEAHAEASLFGDY